MKAGIIKILNTPLETSVEDWAFATTAQNLKRAKDIVRDKKRAVNSFFALIRKSPDEITTADVREWHQKMLDTDYSERYICANFSHLSTYFEWLRKLPEFIHFIKVNPVRAVMPKAPKKYNSPKAKSLTDEELTKLWLHLEKLSNNDDNLIAVRDYAIFRLFMATGMRREEVIAIGAENVKIEAEAILIHTLVKGGTYEWRTVADEEVKDALERYLHLTKRRQFIGQIGRALWIRFDRAAFAAKIDRRAEDPFGDEPRFCSHSFDKNIKKYAHDAEIGHFHIHQFRHTFARIVAEESGSINETQDALGHKDIQTTQIYVNRIKFKKDKYSLKISQRIRAMEVNEEVE